MVRMLREETKISPKGQVVIPIAFRKSQGLHPGNKIIFTLTKKGLLLQKPREDALAVFKEIANSGKSVKIKPHEHAERLEDRYR
jgi:AbrB family looped-hinge helix DNA binding protein